MIKLYLQYFTLILHNGIYSKEIRNDHVIYCAHLFVELKHEINSLVH